MTPPIKPELVDPWFIDYFRRTVPMAPADATRQPSPRDHMRPQPTIKAASGPMPTKGVTSGVRQTLQDMRSGSGAFDPGQNDTAGAWINEFLNPLRAMQRGSDYFKEAASDLKGGAPLAALGGAAMGALEVAGAAVPGPDPKLPKKWAVLTVENPGGTALTAAENATRMRDARRTLRTRGIKFKPTRGGYVDTQTGQELYENGFLLENVSASDAERLAREFGQNGVVTHKGYHDLVDNVLYPSRGVASTSGLPFTEVKGGPRFAADINWEKRVPRAVPKLEDMWRSMVRSDAPTLPKIAKVDGAAGRRMARVYESLPVNDPAAEGAYRALADEVRQQYRALEDAGFKFEFVDSDPYPGGSQEMVTDVARNGRLKVFKTADDQAHPFLTAEENNMFRAVHDALAHAGGGNQFGVKGEEQAYRIHAMTLSPLARRALATETRGQNSWVNFGPNSHLPVKERPFAQQKAALWPEELTGDYSSFPEEAVRIERVDQDEPGSLFNAFIGDREVGRIKTWEDGAIDDAFVEPDVRRKGIGTKLYDAAEAEQPLRPGDTLQSPEAKAFWAARRPGAITAPAIGTPSLAPSSDDVFDASGIGRALPEGADPAGRPPVKYPTRADLSVLDPLKRRIHSHYEPMVEKALKEDPRFAGYYDMSPVQRAFRDISETGDDDFTLFSRLIGPTSTGNKVPQNMREASMMYHLIKQAQGKPSKMKALLADLENGTLTLPKGYSNRRQSSVNAGVRRILAEGDLDPLTSPKTMRFGNAPTGTVYGSSVLDMHVGRTIGKQGVDELGKPARGFPTGSNKVTSSPSNTHYPELEDAMISSANRMGLAPLQHQALGWIGGAEKTNVADKRVLLDIFNEKLRNTAAELGTTPLDVFKRFAKGEIPLYALVGATGGGLLMDESDDAALPPLRP